MYDDGSGNSGTVANSARVDGTNGNDTITGDDEGSTLNGGVGNDAIDGGAGGDYIEGEKAMMPSPTAKAMIR